MHGVIDDSAQERAETISDSNVKSKDAYIESRDASQRPRRQMVKPSRSSDYEVYSNAKIDEEGSLNHIALMAGAELVDVNEALKQSVWRNAMMEDLGSIERNNTWRSVDLPPRKQCIGVKWVFKRKLNPDGTVLKYKARLVAKGFLQRKGVDFTEVFAPVARLSTIRLVVAVSCARKWLMFQLNVKSVFLHGTLKEEVYVQKPPGFRERDNEDKVYKLQKALYGLRQAPRAWNKKINSTQSRF